MLENFKNTVKSVFKFIWNHAVSALKALLDEIIIFAKDIVNAFKFIWNNGIKINRWREAIRRNWYKFAKYIGVLIVIFGGFNFSLVAISFVVLALFVSKFISVSLSSSDNSKAKKLGKAYTVCRVLQVLLPIIAAFILVANWWLLILGLIATLIGDFKDCQHRKKEKQDAENLPSKGKDTNDNEINEKENEYNNLDLQKAENQMVDIVTNKLTEDQAERKVLKGVGRSVWSNLKSEVINGFKDFFYPKPKSNNSHEGALEIK